MDALEKDWREAEQMIVVCRRPDGTIVIHMFDATDEEACQLAIEAFGFQIKHLINIPEVKAKYNLTRV